MTGEQDMTPLFWKLAFDGKREGINQYANKVNMSGRNKFNADI